MKPNPVEHLPNGTSVLTLACKGQSFICYIDTADYPLVKDYRWRAVAFHRSCTFYARANFGNRPHRSTIFMHRLLLPGALLSIDHKDGNGLNNRRDNLRPATQSQQTANCSKRTNVLTASRFKGVSKSGERFYAYVRINGKRKHLGTYSTEAEAALAYDEAAKKHFGEFASLNTGILHDEKKRSIAA